MKGNEYTVIPDLLSLREGLRDSSRDGVALAIPLKRYGKIAARITNLLRVHPSILRGLPSLRFQDKEARNRGPTYLGALARGT